MKYIDSDKLIAEIRNLRSESCISESDEYYEYAKSEIIDIIHNLQQEQPEVDLENEMRAFASMVLYPSQISDCNRGISITMAQLYECARHFYELGFNARKEE